MIEREFITGDCRNTPKPIRHHIYEVIGDRYIPMCGYGWNRGDGDSFSIFRGVYSGPHSRGVCKLCEKNIAADKPAITNGWKHKTKWL